MTESDYMLLYYFGHRIKAASIINTNITISNVLYTNTVLIFLIISGDPGGMT